MTLGSTIPGPIPRADRPAGPGFGPRGFPQAGAGGPRLTAAFVLLQAYLLLSLSAVDEHFKAIGALHPRLFLGLLVLAAACLQGTREKLAAEAGLTLRHGPSRWLAAFLVAGCFSTIWAYDSGVARAPFQAHVLSVLTFMLLAVLVRTRREFLITLLVFCAGWGVFIALSLWEWFHGRHDFTMGVMRMQGAGSMYQDPNSFGATIVFALPIFVWVGIYTTSKLVRLGVLAYGAMLAYCTIKTSSRSTLVLFVFGGLWAVATLPRRSHRFAAILALGLAGVLLASTLSPSQVKRIKSVVSAETYERESSTRGRIIGYVVGYQMFKQRPIVGVGPGNWGVYRKRKFDGRVLEAHNLLGSLLAERGLLGALTFLGFVVSSMAFGFRNWLALRKSADPWDRAVAQFCSAMLCTYAVLLISGLGAHNLDRPNWYWSSALMIVAVGCRKAALAWDPRAHPEAA